VAPGAAPTLAHAFAPAEPIGAADA
ncbi:hypothetical protein GA0115280_109916, partial [Streptomyces sp. Cmuel-A718b]